MKPFFIILLNEYYLFLSTHSHHNHIRKNLKKMSKEETKISEFTIDQEDEINNFFAEHGYVVIKNALTSDECKQTFDDICTAANNMVEVSITKSVESKDEKKKLFDMRDASTYDLMPG